MANPTTNFGWVMPTATDLVTDLPADFAVFGQGVDTSMAYLLGGTTGQVLSKTSATNMAFTWINNDQGDLTAITAGTGISVTSGTGPIPSVAIDTAVTVDKTTAQTLTNKTLTTPIISSISNTGTLTLPTSTDTLVGRATTDTLTNKTLTSPALTTPTISTLTTNGDLLYGTGSGALSRLGIGSTSQVLTVTGGVPVWAAAGAGGGKVLQVVTATSTTETNNSTTTQTDSTLTLSITPTANTSRVLVMVYTPIGKSSGNANNGLYLRIMRGATEILLTNVVLYTGTTLTSFGTFATQIVDSPATTSATTYKLQFANYNASASVTVQQNGAIGTIIAMEIGA